MDIIEDFSKMSLSDRIQVVNERIGGDHPDRITQPNEVIDMIGKNVYFVISPLSQERNIGNATIYEWMVDRITSNDGTVIENVNQISLDDDERYICINDNIELKALSLKDFNIIPNIYNNHAAFISKEGAEAYAIFRKLQWAEDDSLSQLMHEYDFWITDEQLKNIQENE